MFRKHGRYMSKGGYVDSSRRVRSLQRQQEESQGQPSQNSLLRNSLPATIQKSSSTSTAAPKKPKQAAGVQLPSVIAISTDIESKEREYDKQMRMIEVNTAF
jgi:hypothetical protein